jgi:hypothetical protein
MIIHTTTNMFELTPFKEQAWNPLDFAKCEEETETEIDTDYIDAIEEQIIPTLKRVRCDEFTNLRAKHATLGFEVGDDRVDISNSSVTLGRELVVQEKLYKMKTSWKDTYISKTDWNFCEVTSGIPASICESIDYARKTGTFTHLGYSDAPVLRLIGNVQKSDKSHSSSATGKASMLARRLMTPRKCNRPILMIASWIQDGCLNTVKNDEPKYLEGIVGGAGCPPLWDNPANSYLYVRAYKGGTYSRIYGTAINEARYVLSEMDSGRPSTVILCARLREKQEYLHATYAQNVLVPPRPDNPGEMGKSLPTPLYKAAGAAAFVQAAERRLLATKRTLTRPQAEVELMRTKRICETIFGLDNVKEKEHLDRLKRREETKQFDFALRANAAVSRLLNRCATGEEVKILQQEGFLNVGTGVLDISKADVEWLVTGGRGEVYAIQDILRSEDMFVRAEVSMEESMKVPGLVLVTQMEGQKPLIRTTKAKVGLWQVDGTQEEWSDNVVAELLQYRDYGIIPGPQELITVLNKNREWVSDDAILVESARIATMGKPIGTIALISTDLRLGRHIAAATGFHVVVVSPEIVIRLFKRETWSASSIELDESERSQFLKILYLEERVPAVQEIILYDTGSFSASAMRYGENKTDSGHKTGTMFKSSHRYTEVIDGHRVTRDNQVTVSRTDAFVVKILAANGSEQRLRINPFPEAAVAAPATRTRFRRLTQFVSKSKR